MTPSIHAGDFHSPFNYSQREINADDKSNRYISNMTFLQKQEK